MEKLVEMIGKMNGPKPLKVPPKGCRTPKTNIAPNERPREPFVFARALPPKDVEVESRAPKARAKKILTIFDKNVQKTAAKNRAFAVHRGCCKWLTCPPSIVLCSLLVKP